MEEFEYNILEKYNLIEKAKNTYNQNNSGPTNTRVLYETYAEVVEEKRRMIIKELQKLQDTNCIQGEGGSSHHDKCFFRFYSHEHNECDSCEFYHDKLKELMSARDELNEASKIFRKNAIYKPFLD